MWDDGTELLLDFGSDFSAHLSHQQTLLGATVFVTTTLEIGFLLFFTSHLTPQTWEFLRITNKRTIVEQLLIISRHQCNLSLPSCDDGLSIPGAGLHNYHNITWYQLHQHHTGRPEKFCSDMRVLSSSQSTEHTHRMNNNLTLFMFINVLDHEILWNHVSE